MLHKIMAGNSLVSLEVREQKGELQLYIAKSDSKLTFNLAQTKQINAIIQAIDSGNFALKEYGKFQKGLEVFKISISEFRGIKSIQIRERLTSPTFNGFGKQGVALPTYKLKELQMHLTKIMQEFVDMGTSAKTV